MKLACGLLLEKITRIMMSLTRMKLVESSSETFLDHLLLSLCSFVFLENTLLEGITDALGLALNENPQCINCANLRGLRRYCCYHIA